MSVLSSEFEYFFLNNSFDVCINASGSGDVGYSIVNPLNDFESNALAVTKILDCIKSYQPKCKYLHISSAAVYGNPLKLPIQESDALSPLSPYGFNKLISETICREYYQIFGISIAIIRPFSVYGDGLKKQLLWDLCNFLSNSDYVELYGSGMESRDFIHVIDVVRIVDLIIEKTSFNCEIFNVANGQEVLIRDLVILVKNEFINKEIGFTGTQKAGDPLNWKADITKINTLGYLPLVNLKDGIENYTKWFRKLKYAQ